MLDGGWWFAVAMVMEVKAKTSMMVKPAMAKKTDPECVRAEDVRSLDICGCGCVWWVVALSYNMMWCWLLRVRT